MSVQRAIPGRNAGRAALRTSGGTAALAAFAAITFGWTWGLWAIVALIGQTMPGLAGGLFLASAFGPGVAGLATVALLDGRAGLSRWIKRCLRWRVGCGWYALALLAPSCTMGVALGLHALSGGTIPAATTQVNLLTLLGQFVVITIFGGPLGEEFGWRGYALPALTDLIGWRGAAVLVGVVWGIWHLPLFWLPGTAQADLPMGLFLASTVSLSVVFARLAVNTAFSVLPAILLHGSINWASMILPVMPADGDARAYTVVMVLLILTALGVVLKSGPGPHQRST